MQPDPAGLKGAKVAMPETLNRYAYVHNDPVNLVDYNGAEADRPYDPFQALWDLWAHSRDLYAPLTQPEDANGGSITPTLSVTVDDLIRALQRLPRVCINFFGGQETINQRIQELRDGTTMMIQFKDMRSQGGQLIPDDVYGRTYQQYWEQDAARGGDRNALAKSMAINGPGIDKTILLGSGYFDPGWMFAIGNFMRGTFPRGTEQLQELVLIHEYMHILNNMNEEQLFRKWTTGPGAAAISEADRSQWGEATAEAIWMTNGCPRRNQ